jgi:T4 RnlA family RNA ligase
LHKHKKAYVFEKLDGSMIHFFRMPDGSVTCSTCRSTNSIQAKQAKEFAFNNAYLLNKIVQSIDYGFTPIFEWVAPHNQIVCHYKNPRLVYLNSRNRSTGEYFFEEKYADKAVRYDIEFSDILNHINGTEMEGYVCHLSCGTILKVKTPWYLTRHRAVDIMMSPKYKVMDLALQGCLDDVISNAPDMHKQVLMDIDSVVKNDVVEFHAALIEEYSYLTRNLEMNDTASCKKQVASACQASPNFPAMMMLYQNKDTKSFVSKKLYEKYKSLYPNKLLNSET